MARVLKLTAVLTGCVVLGALVSPASSPAAVSCVPSGVSGITQFFETLPAVNCDVPSPRPGATPRAHARRGSGVAGTGGGTGGALQSATAGRSGTTGTLRSATGRRLSDQGAIGAAVLQLVAQTGTAPAGRGRAHRLGPGTAAGANAHPGSGRGLLGGLVHPLLASSRHGGAGALLALLLALSVVTIAAVRVAGRRRRA